MLVVFGGGGGTQPQNAGRVVAGGGLAKRAGVYSLVDYKLWVLHILGELKKYAKAKTWGNGNNSIDVNYLFRQVIIFTILTYLVITKTLNEKQGPTF